MNVGAIIALAPNLKPFTDLLEVDEETVKAVLNAWGPGKFDAELLKIHYKSYQPQVEAFPAKDDWLLVHFRDTFEDALL